jgi:hypothetical protein
VRELAGGRRRRIAVEELGRRVARWVEAGVIGREQADAILAWEGAGREPAGGRRAVVVEVLGYLGGVLALVAGVVLGAESWAQLGHWGRVGVLAAVTGVLLAAGWWLRGAEGRVLPRLASVLWLGAVAAFAGLLGVLGDRGGAAVLDPSLGAAGGALVLAGGLFLLERRVLQQLALFASLASMVTAAIHQAGWPWTVWGYGCLALGLVWLELGRRGLVGPRRTTEALGSLALLVGPAALAVEASGPAELWLWAGLGLAVGLIVAGSALRRSVPLGIGAAGMVVFLGRIAGEHWRDLGAPLAILVVGLGLVAAAVVVARLRPAGNGTPR